MIIKKIRSREYEMKIVRDSICCKDMNDNIGGCVHLSTITDLFTIKYMGMHLIKDITINYCPWCGEKIRVMK